MHRQAICPTVALRAYKSGPLLLTSQLSHALHISSSTGKLPECMDHRDYSYTNTNPYLVKVLMGSWHFFSMISGTHPKWKLVVLLWYYCIIIQYSLVITFPDSKVHGANMGPTWVLLAHDGPHVGPMNLAIGVVMMTWHGIILCIIGILLGESTIV